MNERLASVLCLPSSVFRPPSFRSLLSRVAIRSQDPGPQDCLPTAAGTSFVQARGDRPAPLIRVAALLIVGFAGLVWGFGAGDLTPSERRGKGIYLTLVSPSETPIIARLGSPPVEVPASIVPCVNCHGYDGRGLPEGGVVPSDISWEFLTKPYEVTLVDGRRRPPYNEQKLKRAITMGIDSANQELDSAMPRFLFSHQDLADLVAYLKRIETDLDPGLEESSLRIGVLLPPAGRYPEQSAQFRGFFRLLIDQHNRQGGIYGRQIDLRLFEVPAESGRRAEALRDFVDREKVFALAAAFPDGAEPELAALAAEKSLPIVAAFAPHPQLDFPLNRYVFYLSPGLADQSRALGVFGAGRWGPDGRGWIVGDNRPVSLQAAAALLEECRRRGWTAVDPVDFSGLDRGDGDGQGTRSPPGVIFFLGFHSEAEEQSFLEWISSLQTPPALLVPEAAAAGRALRLPAGFRGKVFLALSAVPSNQTGAAQAEYRRLSSSLGLPDQPSGAAAWILASAKVLFEGLQLSGRSLRREKLISALEGLYRLQTGLTPPLSFGPNRRVGSRGAYILEVDPNNGRMVPVGGFISVEE